MAKTRKTRSDSIGGMQITAAVARDVLIPKTANLSDLEAEIFMAAASQLPASERIKPAVALMLTEFAKSAALVTQMDDLLKSEGYVIQSPTGQKAVHPGFKVRESAHKQMLTAFRACSLSPSGDKADLVRQAALESQARGGRPLAVIPPPKTGEAPDWVAMAADIDFKNGGQ